MVGGTGAPCKAHAEDCLSAKFAIVANVREFHRQAEGELRRVRGGAPAREGNGGAMAYLIGLCCLFISYP